MVHAYAIYIVCRSAFLFSVKCMVTVCLLSILVRIMRNPNQSISFKQLELQSGKWFLYDKNGVQSIYERHRVIIEAGIFFLLELSNSDVKTTKIVFFDQLVSEDYRTLKLIEKTY